MIEEGQNVEVEMTDITMGHFYKELSEKVSTYNAKLLLHTAAVRTGIANEHTNPLNKDDVKAVCLELIKKGGPAFQVGKSIYQKVH